MPPSVGFVTSASQIATRAPGSCLSRRRERGGWTKDGDLRQVEVALGTVGSADGRLTHWVIAFSDRSEVEQLRAEVESLKNLAAASLGLRLDPAGEPARGAQKAGVEIPAPAQPNPHRKPPRLPPHRYRQPRHS